MSAIDVYLEQFKARLFPLRKRKELGDSGCKRPLVDEWQKRNYSREQLLEFWTKGHPLGWALGPGDLVVDIDAPTADRPDKKGPESLSRLEKVLGSALESVTVEVQSPSGGRHFYLTKPAEVQIHKSIAAYPGAEFISSGGYVVIAGSPHWQGGTYRFSELATLIGDFERAAAPKSLLDLIGRDPETLVDPARLPDAISGELLEKMLSELDPTSYRDYPDFRKMLFAAHSATRGSKEGLEVFVSWSTSDPKYADAAEDVRGLWRKLKPTKLDGITIGTIFQELKDLGKLDVVRLVRAAMDFQAVPGAAPRVEKDVIRWTLDEEAVNEMIVGSLAKAKSLYQRAGALVSIKDGGSTPLSAIQLCELASSVCTVLESKTVKGGAVVWNPVRFPERLARMLVSRGEWFGIPTLRSVTPIPVFTAGGVLQTPGFDPGSGVFYKRTLDVPTVSLRPSRSEARAALDRLLDVVVDFPFAGGAHRSTWLAGLLSILARPAIDGPLPLFFVVGNQAGIGKSLLVKAISFLLYGKDPPSSRLSTDEEEMGKTVLAAALKNDPIALFDNLPNGSDFGSPVLDSVLTSRSVRGRLLGQTKIIEAEIETTFFATGNRIGISKDSDSFRRLAFCSLEYADENPKGRTGFRHGSDESFLRWILANRARLIADALTVLQAAKVAEAELPSVPAWGSYLGFSQVVRRALVWLGEPDPIETQTELERWNEETDEIASVVEGLRKVLGVGVKKTTAEILTALRDAVDNLADTPELVETRSAAQGALDILAPGYMKNPGMAIAKRLKSRFRDRPSGGAWIRASKDAHSKQLVYSVEKVERI
jgi:hypothetical protein